MPQTAAPCRPSCRWLCCHTCATLHRPARSARISADGDGRNGLRPDRCQDGALAQSPIRRRLDEYHVLVIGAGFSGLGDGDQAEGSGDSLHDHREERRRRRHLVRKLLSRRRGRYPQPLLFLQLRNNDDWDHFFAKGDGDRSIYPPQCRSTGGARATSASTKTCCRCAGTNRRCCGTPKSAARTARPMQ